MISIFSIGYLNSTIFLLLISGLFMLVIDVKGYNNEDMMKEKKLSLFLGWILIGAGLLMMVGSWTYKHFFW